MDNDQDTKYHIYHLGHITTLTTLLAPALEGECLAHIDQYRHHTHETFRLSAIMLGRLQMTVDDALELYDLVGNDVFAKPRYRLLPSWTKILFTRYSSERMERTLVAAMATALEPEYQRRRQEGGSKGLIPLANENPDAAQT